MIGGFPSRVFLRQTSQLTKVFFALVLCWMIGELSVARGESKEASVAEWILMMGGSIEVEGQPERIRQVSQLPDSDFRIVRVDLVGTNINPPDLARLSDLTRIKSLHLPGPMWNPSAGARIDYSKELGHLSQLTSLEELAFSATYLEGIKFQDEGIEAIRNLGKTLKKLSLENTAVRGRSFADFTALESLDLVYCPVDDKGLSQLGQLKQLRHLLLRDALISDQGLKVLSPLIELEHLDLGGTKISDDGLESFRQMKKISKLNLQGTMISDRSAPLLASMNELEELNLYGTKISNLGIEQLRGLFHLKRIDLRYTRVSRAGYERLRSSLPECDIEYLELSPQPVLSDAALKNVQGKGDRVVAEWIEALGGSARLIDGEIDSITLATTGVTDPLLENLKGLARLRTLDLRNTEIGNLGVERLTGLKGLEEIYLGGTAITDEAIVSLKELNRLRVIELKNTGMNGSRLDELKELSLEELHLSNSPIDDEGLSKLSSMPSLKKLTLAYTDLTDRGLASLEGLRNLESLDLDGTDITDGSLASIGRLARLSELLLSYTKITDKGLRHLENCNALRTLTLVRTRVTNGGMASIAKLTDLRRIDFDYTELGDAGLLQLEPLLHLEQLSLDSTHLTDACSNVLSRFSHLREINLYHTFLTQRGFDQIQKSLPNCKIIWDATSSDPKRRRS